MLTNHCKIDGMPFSYYANSLQNSLEGAVQLTFHQVKSEKKALGTVVFRMSGKVGIKEVLLLNSEQVARH